MRAPGGHKRYRSVGRSARPSVLRRRVAANTLGGVGQLAREVRMAKANRHSQYCCVVGCHNSHSNTKGRDPPVMFYRFPGRPWEKRRREAWIRAVRRVNPDGSPWRPSSNSRVCSDHFLGLRRVDVQRHPDYLPSVFPDVYSLRSQRFS
ncbi:unnamed protein product, partial [Ixodes pacificus]